MPFHSIRVLVLVLVISLSSVSEGRGVSSQIKGLTVDSSGHGDFSTIQSAIDSVPSNNKFWFLIHVKAGIYSEKVQIPYDKPYIILEGEGKHTTKVVWSDHDSTAQSPTFASFSDHTIVRYISFLNSYNLPSSSGMSSNPISPAVAGMIAGDESAFFYVGFEGFQDTLWDSSGRHYFYGCTIRGAVDFIFGSGRSIYEKCEIQVDKVGDGNGYITAQGRNSEAELNGFVFKYCEVVGSGMAYLGRAWRGYATVLFYRSNLSNVIVPAGWDSWNSRGHEEQLTFAEYECFGPGSNTTGRVEWEKKLSEGILDEFTSRDFVDRGRWLEHLPDTQGFF